MPAAFLPASSDALPAPSALSAALPWVPLLQGFDNVNNLLFSNGYAPGLLVQIMEMKVIATSICRGSGLQASMGLEGRQSSNCWRLITGWGVVTSWLQAASAVQLILPAT